MNAILMLALWAGMQLPRAGCSLNAAGELRVVQGVGGNLISGAAERIGVRDAACSDNLALIGDGQEFLVIAGNDVVARRPKTGERTLLGITRVSAGVWEPGWIHLWAHSRWTTLPVTGDWLAFSPGGDGVLAVVRDGDGAVLRRLDASGRVLEESPAGDSVRAAFVWPDRAMALVTGDGVVFRSGAREQKLPIEAESLAAMSDDWVEARGVGSYAIRRKGERIEWFALP
ncbi:MAG: hypothetical protein U0Q16_35565 [Bryobacteraceae bacterium]